jgi:hypothetical protein
LVQAVSASDPIAPWTVMYAAYIMKRTQIYLDEAQSRELAKRAGRRGTTSSHVIREAVDAYLAQPETEEGRMLLRFQEALDAAFGVAPGLPDGATYVEELRAADADRAAGLAQLGRNRRRP